MVNQAPPCPSGRYWQVEAGDSFYLIALRLGTTVAELQLLNPGVDPFSLQTGQLLCLPPEPVCPSGVFWRVTAGDSLYSIAAATGTTVARLLELNPDIEPQNLQIGQAICLPG
jgi:LysM repeat protein